MSVTRFLAGLLALAVVAAGTWALWPASEADKARDDGEAVGQAVNHLYYAESTEEVDSALDELNTAVADAVDHRGDAVGEQVSEQTDAL